jgi:hypothetical protein
MDRDLGVVILIDDIEQGIRNSRICLAEIILDTPNVCFELGYVLVCSNELYRDKPFPFDVRHRNLIIFDSNSISSFNKLQTDIVNKMTVLLQKESIVNESLSTGVVVTGGLRPHEVTALIVVMVNSVGSGGIAMYALKEEMQRNGYI